MNKTAFKIALKKLKSDISIKIYIKDVVKMLILLPALIIVVLLIKSAYAAIFY